MITNQVVMGVLELSSISKRLHKADERSCNGFHSKGAETRNDNQVRALLARANTILGRHNKRAYHQEDPRGCSLYALPFDTPTQKEHEYSSIGVALPEVSR